jgi:hypothetical protein
MKRGPRPKKFESRLETAVGLVLGYRAVVVLPCDLVPLREEPNIRNRARRFGIPISILRNTERGTVKISPRTSRRVEMTARHREILAALGEELNLQRAGDRFGITRERVRQIAERHGFDWKGPKRDRREQDEAARIAARPVRPTNKDRFMGYVSVTTDGHWEWVGAYRCQVHGKTLQPTPIFNHRGKTRPSYRAAWELFVGEIPAGANVIRNCGNRNCVRPEHLFLGGKGDFARQRTLHGHSNRRGHISPYRIAEAGVIA